MAYITENLKKSENHLNRDKGNLTSILLSLCQELGLTLVSEHIRDYRANFRTFSLYVNTTISMVLLLEPNIISMPHRDRS